MASKREEILAALFASLDAIAGPRWRRNDTLPERIPAGGICILRDGDPGEAEIMLSPPEYIFEHRAELEIVIEEPTADARDATFDALLVSIGAAIAADRTLAGRCDWIEAEAPVPLDIAVEGSPGLKAVSLPIILHYGVPLDPLS